MAGGNGIAQAVDGGIVDLYPCAEAGNDHWLDVGRQECGPISGQFICTEFIDTKNTSMCLSLNLAEVQKFKTAAKTEPMIHPCRYE
jgi:hypothetical protein